MFVYTDFAFSNIEKTEIVETQFSQDIKLINSCVPEWSIFSYFRDKKHRLLTE